MDQLDTGDVTFETNTHGMHLGNPHLKLLPVELSRRGTPVFVHPSSAPNHQQVALDRPRPMLELIFDSARTVSDLVFSGHVAKYPDIPWFSPTAVACCRCSPIEMELLHARGRNQGADRLHRRRAAAGRRHPAHTHHAQRLPPLSASEGICERLSPEAGREWASSRRPGRAGAARSMPRRRRRHCARRGSPDRSDTVGRLL